MAGTPEVARANGKKGGRPVSSATKLTRKLANELCREGFDGLSGMVDNMLFWRSKARELSTSHEELIAKLNSLPVEQTQELSDTLKEFNKVSAYYIAARDKYHECSRDVAPYTNPRLQSITIKKSSVHTEISMNLKPAADDTERTYRDGAVVPFKRPAAD